MIILISKSIGRILKKILIFLLRTILQVSKKKLFIKIVINMNNIILDSEEICFRDGKNKILQIPPVNEKQNSNSKLFLTKPSLQLQFKNSKIQLPPNNKRKMNDGLAMEELHNAEIQKSKKSTVQFKNCEFEDCGFINSIFQMSEDGTVILKPKNV